MNTTHTSEPIEQKEKQKATRLLDELDLRDYFAAKAIQGIIGTEAEGGMLYDRVAEVAYMYADAMLKARGAS